MLNRISPELLYNVSRFDENQIRKIYPIGGLYREKDRGLSKQFNASADQIKKFSKKPPDSDMLEVYSLYKQATVGDINTSKPSEHVALSKWNAWNSKKGMTSNQAKEKYITKVKELAPKFA